jgi:hypothetical protein
MRLAGEPAGRLVAAMSEHFLEEQLKRIREMTEQMTRLRTSASELFQAFERERAVGRHDQLHEMGDFHTPSLPEPERDRGGEPAGRQPARQSSRSRRR